MPRRKKLGRPKGALAVYRRYVDRLLARMEGGEWPVGTVLPSLETLAKEYRVGVRVIRTAVEHLKGEGWITSNARRRLIVQTPEAGASLSKGVLLEVLMSSMNVLLNRSQDLVSELHRGFAVGAGEMDLPVLTIHSPHLRTALPPNVLQYPIKGVATIWMHNKALFKEYEKLNVPVVMIDRPEKTWKLHASSVDNFKSAREGTARLIALGHRRIAFVGYIMMWKSEVDPDAEERKRGFLAAFKDAGLRPPREGIFMYSDYDTVEAPSIQRLLHTRPPFTAILTTSPGCAELVIKAAGSKGLNVPRDLSVACFQGTQAERPDLSGPRVDFAELARQAAHLLNLPRKPAKQVRLPALWHAGKTVAPPRKG